MTKVLEIKELYKLIPETAKLENVNFGNLRQLLTSVIEKVEKSGTWEFVQYISASPSLFIVREKEVNQTSEQKYGPFNPIEEINNHYSSKPEPKVSKPSTKEEKVEKNPESTISGSPEKLFDKTNLPW